MGNSDLFEFNIDLMISYRVRPVPVICAYLCNTEHRTGPKIIQIFNHFTAFFDIRIAFFSPCFEEIRSGRDKPISSYCRLVRTAFGSGSLSLSALLSFLENHAEENITLSEAARQVSKSGATLTYKKYRGKPPSRFKSKSFCPFFWTGRN
ncbi:MAG: hypothetical protein A2293_05805 [Elusimicrobia bacterium RIFOXYB2_FULL_49_7]|nr:MAG: hypothetical protein A2293_05805 [Elusimicrobia bacterium RIFOXYB2_FULL_49_7]